MNHRKMIHPASVPTCDIFVARKCQRSDGNCWFGHPSSKKAGEEPSVNENVQRKPVNQQVFCEDLQNPFPPDQIRMMFQMVNQFCKKMDSMEKRLEELMN